MEKSLGVFPLDCRILANLDHVETWTLNKKYVMLCEANVKQCYANVDVLVMENDCL